jgi:GT2 family glycosyltransferase
MTYSLKQKLGAIVYDLPRFLWAMRPAQSRSHTNASWVLMRNRDEQLIETSNNRGVACDWEWTSDLHLAKVFPQLGLRLMKRALRDWPIESRDEPEKQQDQASPALSFIIGHRGKERLPHLLATLRSIAAQRDVSFECMVVEQSTAPEVKHELPSWVRYIHTPLPSANMPYSRAWAFNVGARGALGRVLVLHDNDMLAPVDYGKEVIARFEDGYEVMNVKRFIFYLTEVHTATVLSGSESLSARPPDKVVQNLEAGGSLAITREGYFAIGGFDESFVGWGGEDNEFWERAQTRRVWPYSYLPIVHLWHPAQPHKEDADNPNLQRYQARSSSPVEARIEELAVSNFGSARCSVEDSAAPG